MIMEAEECPGLVAKGQGGSPRGKDLGATAAGGQAPTKQASWEKDQGSKAPGGK
jgi:hypothetical protein